MVRDDYFYLRKWVAYYGGLFGVDTLHVLNHGNDPVVNEIAEGCSVIALPGEFDDNFDAQRWRFLTHMTNALGQYYDYVIVGDVDEFLVVDPDTGLSLPEFIAKRRGNLVLTPVGLEVIHRADVEQDTIDDAILGPRQHVRFSTYFCKPCIVGKDAQLARGGHYADFKELKAFRNLYLFHMKYADKPLFMETAARRNALAHGAMDVSGEQGDLSKHWYFGLEEHEARLTELANLPIRDGFNFMPKLKNMDKTWEPRNETLWHFKKEVGRELFVVPDRFHGLI